MFLVTMKHVVVYMSIWWHVSWDCTTNQCMLGLHLI